MREWFHQSANQIIEMTPKGLVDFRGTYEEYLASQELEISELKSAVLSLEWEITDGTVRRLTEEVERLMALHNRVTIRAGNSSDEAAPVDRLKARRDAEPPRCAQKDAVRRMVDEWVCQLDEKQRAVVDRRFGLHGYRRATLEQIGAEIGVTRERVRQIQLDALKNLKAMMERNGISGDVILD